MADRIVPVTQVEKRLAAMAGQTVDGIRDPVTRREKLLAELADAMGAIGATFEFKVVTTLPATGEFGTFYLKSAGGLSPDVYDEYVWLTEESRFEQIGSTRIDLSGYVPTSRTINGKALTGNIVLTDSDIFSNSDIADSDVSASIDDAFDEVFGS